VVLAEAGGGSARANREPIRRKRLCRPGLPAVLAGLSLLLAACGLNDSLPPVNVPARGLPVSQVAFSPGGKFLVFMDVPSLYSYLTHVRVSDVATGRVVATVTDRHGVDAAAFSPDGKTLATLDVNGSIYLRDVATGRLTATLADPGGGGGESGLTLAFSPDGSKLAASYADGGSYLWDVASRRTISSVGYRGDQILGIAYSTDGTMLATFDFSGVNVWRPATRQVIASWTTPDTTVAALAFSPRRAMLATCQEDGSIYLRDLASGRKSGHAHRPQRLPARRTGGGVQPGRCPAGRWGHRWTYLPLGCRYPAGDRHLDRARQHRRRGHGDRVQPQRQDPDRRLRQRTHIPLGQDHAGLDGRLTHPRRHRRPSPWLTGAPARTILSRDLPRPGTGAQGAARRTGRRTRAV
jgi:hypothetical protein